MACQEDQQMYIDGEASDILQKALCVVSCELVAVANLYYLEDSSEMASSGSAGFVRGRGGGRGGGRSGGFQIPRNQLAADTDVFRLTVDHYDMIVSYLEIPENFAAITGGGRKTIVGKKYGSKMTVFKAMLAAIQHHGFPTQITAANLQKRFQRYIKKYKDARWFKLDTGGGLTEDEIAAGVILEAKLERLCPHFERMHALYGARPNMAPPVLGDAGVEHEEIYQHEEGTPHEEITQPVDDDDNHVDNHGDLEDDSEAENLNPNTPTNSTTDGATLPGVAETPATLRNRQVKATFWAQMEEMAHLQPHHGMAVHPASCLCPECRNFVGINTGENLPTETGGDTQPPSQRSMPTETGGDTQPPSQRSMSSNGPPPAHTPTPKKVKSSAAQAAKDVMANSKPSFTSIYAERIKEKADYRKELIQSRDKWKAQDLEERRLARLETYQQELNKSRLERRHQLQLEAAMAENARKKARLEFEHAVDIHISKIKAEQDHEKEMARAARKTALLTTLFGSSKSPAEIVYGVAAHYRYYRGVKM